MVRTTVQAGFIRYLLASVFVVFCIDDVVEEENEYEMGDLPVAAVLKTALVELFLLEPQEDLNCFLVFRKEVSL